MNPIRYIPFFIAALLVAVVPPAAAQQDGASSLLPDIDPQDIEIRGDFEVRFPGLARQPVLGFSPRPPVFRVDPDRMPFMETDEEIVATIPLSDLEPALRPEKNFIRFAERQRLYAYGGYGSYGSPELRVFAEAPVRDNESISLQLGHQSSSGDRDFSSFRDMAGDLQWTRLSGNNRWGVGISGSSAFNYSPVPVRSGVELPGVPGPPPDTTVPDPLRISHNTLGMKARWQQLTNAYRGWQASAAVNRFADRTGSYPDEDDATSETRYEVHVNRFWEGTMIEQVFGLQFRATGSVYETGLDGTQYWLNNNIGVRYRHTFSSFHQVEAWLRFYQLYDPVNDVDLYLYPDIHYRFKGAGRFSVQMRLRGFVNDPSLESLHLQNRFTLNNDRELEHERGLHINLHSGVDIWNGIELYSGLDYWQYYNRGYFTRWGDPAMPLYRHQYVGEATHVEWYTGLSRVFRTWRTTMAARIGLNYTSAEEDVIPSGEIPYVPRWKGSVLVTTNPVSWFGFSGWMDLSGKRKTLDGESLDGFVQLGARTDIRVHPRFGIYLKARNILNQEYEVWQQYQELPFQIYGGITLHW